MTLAFRSTKLGQFTYFSRQVGDPVWRGKNVLDFGGNIGNILRDPKSTIDQESYWCLDVVNAAGCSPADIVKSTLLLADIKDFKAVDAIYAAWLPGLGVTALPARTAFAAASLPAGALVMLEVVAAYPVD